MRLAIPLAAANLGQVLIGAVDTAVVGRLGEVELGAAGLGNSVYFVVIVVGMGIMLGLDPLVAQAIGAEEPVEARRMLWQGSWLALLLGAPLAITVAGLGVLLERFGIGAATAEATRAYMFARLPGLVPFLVFVACRSYLQAVSITRPVVLAVVIANVVNLPLSWALVFGDAGLAKLGLPALGVPALRCRRRRLGQHGLHHGADARVGSCGAQGRTTRQVAALRAEPETDEEGADARCSDRADNGCGVRCVQPGQRAHG